MLPIMRTQRSGYIINISSTAGLIGVYSDRFKRALHGMEEDERNGSKPGKVAVLVDYIINHPSPRPRYMLGPILQQIAVHLRKFIPSQLFEWIIMKSYKM